MPQGTRLFSVENTQISFYLNGKMRLAGIIWTYRTDDGEIQKVRWGERVKETWDFNEANENDLIRAFEELALQNPGEFKELYYVLKEHDDVTFPCIQATLKQIQQTFNFE